MRRFRTRVFLALVLSAAVPARASGPVAKPDLAEPSAKWLEVRSAHFVLLGDAGRPALDRTALTLETLRAVLGRITPDLRSGRRAVRAPLPTLVYVFADKNNLVRFRGPLAQASAFFSARADGAYLAIHAGDPEPLRLAAHEYLHYFLHGNFGAVPLWLDEGLAEFYSTVQRTDRRVELGRPLPEHLVALRGGLFPLAELFRLTRESSDYTAERTRAVYATSWALAHYLLAGDGTRRAQLGDMLDLLRAGVPAATAFDSAFGVAPAVLEKELDAHVARLLGGTFAFWRIDFDALEVPATTTARPLPHDDVLAALGLLLAGQPATAADAEPYFRAALERDPRDARALFGLGLLRSRPQPTLEAAELFRRAREADASLGLAAWFEARARLALIGDRPRDEAALAGIRALLERSVALNPDHAESRELLRALSAPAERDRLERERLERAAAAAPAEVEPARALYEFLFARRDWDAARAALARVRRATRDPAVLDWVRQNELVVRFNEAAQAIESGRVAEGRATARRVIDETPPGPLRETFEKELAALAPR